MVLAVCRQDKIFKVQLTAFPGGQVCSIAKHKWSGSVVMHRVSAEGNKALVDYSRKFNGIDLSVSRCEVSAGESRAARKYDS